MRPHNFALLSEHLPKTTQGGPRHSTVTLFARLRGLWCAHHITARYECAPEPPTCGLRHQHCHAAPNLSLHRDRFSQVSRLVQSHNFSLRSERLPNRAERVIRGNRGCRDLTYDNHFRRKPSKPCRKPERFAWPLDPSEKSLSDFVTESILSDLCALPAILLTRIAPAYVP